MRNADADGSFVEGSYVIYGEASRRDTGGFEPIVELEVGFEDDLALGSLPSEGTPVTHPPEGGALSCTFSHILTTPLDCESGSGSGVESGRAWAWWRSPSATDWLLIPGVGERTDPECGTFYKRLVCSGCGKEYEAVKRSCHNRRCPECWEDWLDRAVSRVCERLLGYKQAVDAWYRDGRGRRRKRRRMGNPKSLILSPPPSEWGIRSWEDVKRLRRKAKQYLRRLGIWGGVLIFHAYRIREDLKPLLKRFGRRYWELVREDVLGLGSWRYYVVLEPHFHVLGYGRLRMKSDVFEAETGWVYKFKRHVGEKEWGLAVRYFLSHATFTERCDSFSYFGNMAENCLVAEVEEEREEELVCEKCGAPLIWEYYDGMRIPAVVRRVVKVYRFRRLVGVKDG